MPRAKALLFLIVASFAGLAGLSRIDKNVDLLLMLPEGLREVEGLKLFRKHFVREEELLVALSGNDSQVVSKAAGSLAAYLEDTGSTAIRSARWRASGEGDVRDLADLAAYAWLNASPTEVVALAERLAPERVTEVLEASMEELAVTPDAREMVLLQYDPLRLLEFPGSPGLLKGLGEQEAAFASTDGLLRLVFLESPVELESRAEIVTWVREVRDLIDNWRVAFPAESAAVAVALTGEAALQNETINGMQRDLTGSVVGTALAVALLFYLVHRRILPLIWLMVALAVTLVLTLGFAALTYGALSAMSAGFAAILIALVADYGVLAWQEGKSGGKAGRELLHEIGPSIFWAAATTAAVFFGLNLSSFPGIAQLGNLVGAGILAGAAVMAFFYISAISGLLGKKKQGGASAPLPPRTIQSRGRAPRIMALLVLASGIVLAVFGPPPLNESYWALRPRNSPALETVEMIFERMPLWEEARLPLLITEGNGDEGARGDPWERFREAQEAGRELILCGEIEELFLPGCLWPDRDRQVKNLALLGPSVAQQETCLAGFSEVGFGQEANEFLQRVLEIWREAGAAANAGGTPCLPSDLENDWPVILSRFVSHDKDGSGTVVLGRIIPVVDVELARSDPYAAFGPLEIDGVYPTGWDCLQGATWPLMLHDFRWVFAPMGAVLLIMLAIVYRNLRHIAATFGIMILSWLFLIALMALFAQLRSLSPALAWLPICEWNFMNLAAIPLLMGIGLDYSIHTTLSMNRHRGDLELVWQRTGKAVILCGLSTAAGFGSLAFASNRGLSSLGTVCCLGILIITALSVVVLPRFLLLCTGRGVRPSPPRGRADLPG